MSKSSLLPRLVRWCLSELVAAELRGSHALQASSALHAMLCRSGVKFGFSVRDVGNKVTAVSRGDPMVSPDD